MRDHQQRKCWHLHAIWSCHEWFCQLHQTTSIEFHVLLRRFREWWGRDCWSNLYTNFYLGSSCRWYSIQQVTFAPDLKNKAKFFFTVVFFLNQFFTWNQLFVYLNGGRRCFLIIISSFISNAHSARENIASQKCHFVM